MDQFFLEMNSRTIHPSRSHIREMIFDLNQYSEKCAIYHKFYKDKKEKEEEMEEGANAGHENLEIIITHEDISIENLQYKWN